MFYLVWADENEIADSEVFVLRKLAVRFEFELSVVRNLPESKLLQGPALVIASTKRALQLIDLAKRKPLNLIGAIVYCFKPNSSSKEELKEMPRILLVTSNIHDVVRKCDQVLTAKGYQKEELDRLQLVDGRARSFQLQEVIQDTTNRFLVFKQQRLLGEFNDPKDYQQRMKPFINIFQLQFDIQKDFTKTKAVMLSDLKQLFNSSKVTFLKEQFARLEGAKSMFELVRSSLFLYTLEKGSLYRQLNYILKNLRFMRYRNDLKLLKIFANLLLLNFFFFYGQRKSISRVFRYTDFKADPVPGSVIMVTNFYSTSQRDDLANFKSRPTKIVIDCHDPQFACSSFVNYIDISSESAFRQQLQVLYCPFTKFKVVKVQKGPQTIIYLKQIPDNPILQRIFDSNFLQQNLSVPLKYNREMNYQAKYQKIAKRMQESSDKSLARVLQWKIKRNLGTLLLLNEKPNIAVQYFKEQLSQRLKLKSIKFTIEECDWEKQGAQKFESQQALIMNNLALCFMKQLKYKEAEKLLHFTNRLKKKLKLDNSATLSNLASLYEQTNKIEEARKVYNQALQIVKGKYGKYSPRTAGLLHNLAYVALHDDPDSCIRLEDQAISIFKQIYGPKSSELGVCIQTKAQGLVQLGQVSKAIELMEEAVNLQQEYYGSRTKQVLHSKLALASLHLKGQDQEAALKIYYQVVNCGRSIFGQKSAEYGKAVFNLGSLLYTRCDLEGAKRYLEDARTVFLFGGQDPAMEKIVDKYLLSLNEAIEEQRRIDG